MPDRSEYYKLYYEVHRDAILERKRERYHSDAEYRQKIKNNFKRRYDKHLRSHSKEVGYTIKKVNGVQLFSIKYVAEMTGLSAKDFTKLETAGVVPKSLYTDNRGWRFYTERQIKRLASVLLKLQVGSILEAEARELIKRDWRTI